MSGGCFKVKTIGKLECFVKLGDPVICLLNKQEKFGVLKFAGKTEFSSGVWYGVALNEPCGKNDGSVGGVRYFRCDDKHGIFVNPKNVYPAKLENETKSFVSQKQVSRRVLPNFIKENSADLTENLTVENSTVDKVSCDENYQSIIVDLEVRPRSKSDNALTKEKTKPSELFSDSPFKYDSSEGKSSSLSKLNNITYTCPSPISVGVNDSKREDFLHPKHSSPLSSTHEESPQTAQELTATENSRQHSANESGANTSLSSTVYHHVELSPQVVVKQSIKLESIRNPRFSAPTWSLEEPESNLNKTFLIPRQQSKTRDNTLIDTELTFTGKKGKYEDREDCQMQGTVSKSEQLSKCESLNSTSLSVAESECDATEARSRSFSKSSVSSVDSLSSIGSTKTNQEKGRLKTTGLSTELSRKLPRTSDASKSKLVKISAESKVKSKKVKKESGTINATLISKSSADKSTANGRGLPSKIRTKSSTTVCNGSRSVLDTPASSKSSLKVRPMSVSSKYKERTPLAKSQPNTSKYSTPVGSKILGTVATRRSTSSPLGNASAFEKKVKMTGSASTSMKSSASARANNHVQVQRSLSQESNKSENVSARQVRNKVVGIVKNQTKQEERKLAPTKTRTVSTSRTENASGRSSDIKSSARKLSVSRASDSNGLPSGQAQRTCLPRKVSDKSEERSFLKKKTFSEDSMKRKPVKEKADTADGSLVNCLSSALTPDILKQTPEVTRQSVGIQVDQESINLGHDCHVQSLNDRYKQKQEKVVESLSSELSTRNRDLEAVLIALQVYSQKVDVERDNVTRLRHCMNVTKEKCLNAEKKMAKETSYRVRLEDEMLTVKSDSAVELALLKAEHERKQELTQAKLRDDHKQDLEKVRKRNIKKMDDFRRSCDSKMKRVEETYVHDIAQINEKHKREIAELESQHSKAIEELVEERHAEIEAIKADYEEQMEQLQNDLTESEEKCNKLVEKLRIADEESRRDIEFRIQDAIAKYKTLPDELESMKFVLEMKNNEVKKLRHSNMELQAQMDELLRIKDRAALLEQEKESLNFVVEHKAQFERQLSQERDKLRLSLDREVAASKRLSLENEELTWRLNAFQNSPTSPTFDRINWRMSGYNSPDSAVFSQRIEESDLESQVGDTKEASN